MKQAGREAGFLAEINNKKKITSREIQTAVRLILPGMLLVGLKDCEVYGNMYLI